MNNLGITHSEWCRRLTGNVYRWAILGVGLFSSFLLIAGCAPSQPENASDAAVDSGGGSEIVVIPTEEVDPSSQDLPESRQLVIWAPDFWVANDETPAGQVIDNVIVQFEQIHEGAKVEIHNKAESGSADMLSTLRSAQRVAPTILPEALLINTQDIWRLVEFGLAQPLTETLTLDSPTFFPFAEASVRYNGDIYGIPFAADLLHASAVDRTESVLPTTWDSVLDGERRYLFPADGRDGQLSLLLQYVGMGGDFDEKIATIDLERLVMLFEFYEAGVAATVIPSDNTELSTFGAVLQAMDIERADLVDTSAAMVLQQQEPSPDILFAPVPTENGHPVSVAQTWSFVILTDDPGQRERILDLIQMLLDPSIHGEWSKFARLLPTTSEAAATWDTSQPYSDFLLRLLDGEETVSVPNGRTYAELLDDIQAGQQAVLDGRMTPEEAANSVRPAP